MKQIDKRITQLEGTSAQYDAAPKPNTDDPAALYFWQIRQPIPPSKQTSKPAKDLTPEEAYRIMIEGNSKD